MPTEPHHIFGTFYDKNGNIIASAPLILTNTRTGDTLSTNSNANGRYLFDCANFTHGYENNDALSLEYNPSYSSSDFTIHLSNDGGSTWESATNDEFHTFSSTGQELLIKITATNTSILSKFSVFYTKE